MLLFFVDYLLTQLMLHMYHDNFSKILVLWIIVDNENCKNLNPLKMRLQFIFNPLTHISQKTGSHFVKTHGLYKKLPS